MAEVIPQAPQFKPIFQEQRALFEGASRKEIQGLEQQKGLVSQATQLSRTELGGQRKGLEDRFASILERLAGREQEEISSKQRVTSREFGRRGIPLSSGVFEQTLDEKLSPIRRFFTGQETEATLSQEAGLRDIDSELARLPLQEQQQILQIAQQIAQIRGQNIRDAIPTALAIVEQRSGVRQAALGRQQERDLAAQESQQDIDLQKFIDQLARGRDAATADTTSTFQEAKDQSISREEAGIQPKVKDVTFAPRQGILGRAVEGGSNIANLLPGRQTTLGRNIASIPQILGAFRNPFGR